AQLTGMFQEDLSARHIDLAKPSCVETFLRSTPRNSCAADEQCLARLATACAAGRAVYVAAVPYSSRVMFSGKVVRANGFTERTVSGVEVRRRPGLEGDAAIRKGLHDFLSDDLKVDSNELTPLVELPPPSKSVMGGVRIAGWSVGGAAVAAAIAGGSV